MTRQRTRVLSPRALLAHRRSVRSFAPVADLDAEVVILGSMPGVASLAAGRYYAHPRNLFWPIMASVLGFDPAVAYESRLAHVVAARIALWDVVRSCIRAGSLDASIERPLPNDFARFFRTHGRIQRVFFNGAKAEALYRRLVLPSLPTGPITYVRLPSTSPANAAQPFERRLQAWREVRGLVARG